ncbi:MAG: hypothetical protein HeimC2_10330 [Candidatus Heimdallarchaeota archaeon LC_2]|nr:MAG: hypothetical protein HeimC2_10330 [Candidatus Heimdallarchaeota archaeon LC_2]
METTSQLYLNDIHQLLSALVDIRYYLLMTSLPIFDDPYINLHDSVDRLFNLFWKMVWLSNPVATRRYLVHLKEIETQTQFSTDIVDVSLYICIGQIRNIIQMDSFKLDQLSDHRVNTFLFVLSKLIDETTYARIERFFVVYSSIRDIDFTFQKELISTYYHEFRNELIAMIQIYKRFNFPGNKKESHFTYYLYLISHFVCYHKENYQDIEEFNELISVALGSEITRENIFSFLDILESQAVSHNLNKVVQQIEQYRNALQGKIIDICDLD